jgi:hypothetical protein
MLFSAKMMAILHLSDEKGTGKRGLKIARLTQRDTAAGSLRATVWQ